MIRGILGRAEVERDRGQQRREEADHQHRDAAGEEGASAAMHSAGPARPWRAIGWPSKQITTEDGSPGMLSMIAVVEPAWWAP